MPDNGVILSKYKEGAEHTPPNFKAPYSENFLFKVTCEILLFKNRNYKVSTFVNLMANKMQPSIVSSTNVQGQFLPEMTF